MFRAFVLLLGILTLGPAASWGQEPAAGHPPLRIFLDCDECETDYLRQNVTFVDYVRDRAVADLHVLVTTQSTGGGGQAWTVKLIGQGRFQNHDHTLTFTTSQLASADDRRKEFARIFRLGLVSYAADSSVLPRLEVNYSRPATPAQTTEKKDPWNFWNFRVSGDGNFNGEASNTSHSYRTGASANRTTDQWKVSISANSNINRSTYKISDTDTVNSVSSSWRANTLLVKSLGPNWSAGCRASVSHSSYSNESRTVNFTPGIEYDVFPYSESTRRSLTVQYSVGLAAYRYAELTIFDKRSETVPSHSVNASLGLRQPWGSLSAAAAFSQHLNHTDRTRLSIFTGTDVRLFKGFSFNIFGNYAKIKDQISLRKGSATTEEVLLRLRQVASNYSYGFNFGISYSFGSIFNNIVNPRYGGSGGGMFFF